MRWASGIWETSIPSVQLCRELKTALKKSLLFCFVFKLGMIV